LAKSSDCVLHGWSMRKKWVPASPLRGLMLPKSEEELFLMVYIWRARMWGCRSLIVQMDTFLASYFSALRDKISFVLLLWWMRIIDGPRLLLNVYFYWIIAISKKSFFSISIKGKVLFSVLSLLSSQVFGMIWARYSKSDVTWPFYANLLAFSIASNNVIQVIAIRSNIL
jgi:hypothetical protein